MPKNQATGRPNRQAFTAEEMFKFREDEYLKTFNREARKKGKCPVNCEEELQQEASSSAPSPSTALAPLHTLTQKSSPSLPDPSSETHSQVGPTSSTGSFPYIESPPNRHHWQPSPANNSEASELQNLKAWVSARLEDFDRRLKAAASGL